MVLVDGHRQLEAVRTAHSAMISRAIHLPPCAIAYVHWVDQEAAAVALRAARQRAGLTQAALGNLAGVSQALISAYENGHRQPTIPTLARLLRAAGFAVRVELSPLAAAAEVTG